MTATSKDTFVTPTEAIILNWKIMIQNAKIEKEKQLLETHSEIWIDMRKEDPLLLFLFNKN